MIDIATLPDNTPILVGSGQVVQREATADAPMQLAALASAIAIAECGAKNIAPQIDTLCVTKLFSDMSHLFFAFRSRLALHFPVSLGYLFLITVV